MAATGDAAYIKQINRSLILQKIIEKKMISRADLSKLTDLTRATISVQAADLLEKELVVETQLEHHSVGRRPIMLSINGQAGFVLGIDLDLGAMTFALSDLAGKVVRLETIPLQSDSYEEVVKTAAKNIRRIQSYCEESRYGLVSVVVGVHGLVTLEEHVHFVPRLGWTDVSLKTDLEEAAGLPITLENNANLCSFAERVYAHPEAKNLLGASFSSGIGLGMMMNEDFFKGENGFAGEAGHMIVVPNGRPCSCGNKGCWEQYGSESALFRELSVKKKQETITRADVIDWIQARDETVMEMMDEFLFYLSVGLNNMINLYNPNVVVLNSELLRFYPEAIKRIEAQLVSDISHYRELHISKLGKQACSLGACALGIKQFFHISTLQLEMD
ncbi:ROK family protein [Domibacillus enclensis]|uniref:ROK family protein n=1 Tax=Domibacillus enclensis TaxID=1017273 RepID=A0A1N6REF0_9BACI|nr:ROK family protein [Domibacillus enclensis]OXS79034.1 ROK family protein [Domibacillus enclensis]SIQ27187.1 Sugar kinase of the NBD/HSP70 family, may contain an N-terminal HTH domain [Domibacillus enclensis]